MTERRSMAAERDAMDRYIAAFLEERVGATFGGRITGVTRFGLFVRLDETGADGLVPVSSLGSEYFTHDDRAHALVGERTGQRYTLGRRVVLTRTGRPTALALSPDGERLAIGTDQGLVEVVAQLGGVRRVDRHGRDHPRERLRRGHGRL